MAELYNPFHESDNSKTELFTLIMIVFFSFYDIARTATDLLSWLQFISLLKHFDHFRVLYLTTQYNSCVGTPFGRHYHAGAW